MMNSRVWPLLVKIRYYDWVRLTAAAPVLLLSLSAWDINFFWGFLFWVQLALSILRPIIRMSHLHFYAYDIGPSRCRLLSRLKNIQQRKFSC